MTDWQSYRAYQCQDCKEYCINKRDAPWTEKRLCRACNIPALEDAPPATTSEQHSERPPAMGVRESSAAHTPNPQGEGSPHAGEPLQGATEAEANNE